MVVELRFIELGVFHECNHPVVVLVKYLQHVHYKLSEIVGLVAHRRLHIQHLLYHLLLILAVGFVSHQIVLVDLLSNEALVLL